MLLNHFGLIEFAKEKQLEAERESAQRRLAQLCLRQRSTPTLYGQLSARFGRFLIAVGTRLAARQQLPAPMNAKQPPYSDRVIQY